MPDIKGIKRMARLREQTENAEHNYPIEKPSEDETGITVAFHWDVSPDGDITLIQDKPEPK